MKIGSFKILGLKMQLEQEKSLGISQLMKFEIDCQAVAVTNCSNICSSQGT